MVFEEILGKFIEHNTMIKEIRFWPFVILFTGLQLAGCKSVGTVQIEVIKPASIVLPNQVNSLIVLNNYQISSVDSFPNKLQKAYHSFDTLASGKIIDQVLYYLNESPRIDSCFSLPNALYRPAKDRLKPIVWPDINQITQKFHVDAVLSLEGFGIIDSLARITEFDGYSYSTYTNLLLYVNSIWRLYIPDSINRIEKWVQRDTLFIPEISNYNEFREAIITKEGIEYLSDEIASQTSPKISNRIAPYWVQVQRDFYYNQRPEMQEAAGFVYRNQWLKAAAIWQKLSTDKNIQTSGAACHNMALACEVEGKLDLALIWEKKAIAKLNTTITYNYYQLLEYRIREEKILNEQFGVIKE
jgi:hypothetical protein